MVKASQIASQRRYVDPQFSKVYSSTQSILPLLVQYSGHVATVAQKLQLRYVDLILIMADHKFFHEVPVLMECKGKLMPQMPFKQAVRYVVPSLSL